MKRQIAKHLKFACPKCPKQYTSPIAIDADGVECTKCRVLMKPTDNPQS